MAVQLVLRRPVPVPAAQLRVIWQGFREGDQAQAIFSDDSGQARRWPSSAARWIQRDGLRQGEEWKVNLPGVPADVDRIVLQIVSSFSRTVGVAVQPLAGDRDDALLHPGAELTAHQAQDVLEVIRSGPSWVLTALNTAVVDSGTADHQVAAAASAPTNPASPAQEVTGAVAPADQPIRGWSGPVTDPPMTAALTTTRPSEKDLSDPAPAGSPAPAGNAAPAGGAPHPGQHPADPPLRGSAPAIPRSPRVPASFNPPSTRPDNFGPQVQIPTRLEMAVDAVRAGGKTKPRGAVNAVVDTSASMRPWMASGQLADVLTAVQAVAGACNRPTVAATFVPGGAEVELELATEPAALLRSHLLANGLRTGDRDMVLDAASTAARRGGLQLLVTDDPSLVAAQAAVIVLLGPPSIDAGFSPGDSRSDTAVVTVPPGPVDVRRLARALADAAATV